MEHIYCSAPYRPSIPLYLGRTIREFARRILVPRGKNLLPRGDGAAEWPRGAAELPRGAAELPRGAAERVVLVGDRLRLAYLSGLGSVRHRADY